MVKSIAFRVSFAAALFVVFLVPTVEAMPVTVPPDLSPGDQYRLAFVTSGVHDATSTDITTYNDFVRAEANSEPLLLSLATTWRAIGSTSAVDARDNTATNPSSSVGVPIYNLSGSRIANNNADLWDGTILASLSIDQHGVGFFFNVWTGTAQSGVGATPSRQLGAPTSVKLGSAGSTDSRWVDRAISAAGSEQRLYGISAVLSVTAVPEPSTFALSFLSAVGLAASTLRRIIWLHPQAS